MIKKEVCISKVMHDVLKSELKITGLSVLNFHPDT